MPGMAHLTVRMGTSSVPGFWWSSKESNLAEPEGYGGYSPGTIHKCLVNLYVKALSGRVGGY